MALLIIGYPLVAQINDSEPKSGSKPESESSVFINDIEIHGLKRTKKHILEDPLKKFIGQDASKIDLNDVRAVIVETGILEPLSVEIEDDPQKEGKILKVEVHEKWTIFPLPIMFINSRGIGGGIGFMDFNALGINDKFLIGGMLDYHGWLAATAYMHTPGINNPLGWNLVLLYSKQDKADSDEKDRDLREYGLTRIFVLTGLNYKINEPVVAFLNFGFDNNKVHDIDNSPSVPEDDGSVVGINPGLRIRKTSWDGYFLSEKKIEIGYTYLFGIDYPSFQKIEIETNYEKSLVPGLRMFARGGFVFSPEAPPLFESSPRSVEVGILPQSFSAQNFLGGSAGLEKCIFKRSFGTLSILSSYQVVYSKGPILGERFDYGVLGGIQFYLRKLAIPAVGLGISYNLAADYMQGAFNIGMSF